MPLVFVPTPLGNLRDITLRSLDVLRDAALIVAEDTRVARSLLAALQLPGRELWSYREQNAAGATAGILERAQTELVAVVSDAGMPGISDPGSALVAAARAAGIAVEVLPGPSAALGAAVLSGFPIARFAFEGFPPRARTARRQAVADALARGVATIWYESPQRIRETLDDIAAVAPEHDVFLVREYTKRFEQQLAGNAQAVAAALDEPVRGEITFVLAPGHPVLPPAALGDVRAEIDRLLEESQSISSIAKALSARGFGDRGELYTLASERKRARGKSGEQAEG